MELEILSLDLKVSLSDGEGTVDGSAWAKW